MDAREFGRALQKSNPINVPYINEIYESINLAIYERIIEDLIQAGKIAREMFDWAVKRLYGNKTPSNLAEIEKALYMAADNYEKLASELQKILDGDYVEIPEDMDEDEAVEYVTDEIRFQVDEFIKNLNSKYGKYVAEAFTEEFEKIIKSFSARDIVDTSYYDDVLSDIDLDETYDNIVENVLWDFDIDAEADDIKIEILVHILSNGRL